MLVFPVAELPMLARGKGNKIIGISGTLLRSREEYLLGLVVMAPNATVVVHSGKRYIKLKGSDLDAYRAERGRRGNAFVDRGAVLEIPVSAADVDGNPMTLTVQGLPAFASYTQLESSGGLVRGVIRFAPGVGHRGDYTLTVLAQDNGDGDINQVAAEAQSFVVTARDPPSARRRDHRPWHRSPAGSY